MNRKLLLPILFILMGLGCVSPDNIDDREDIDFRNPVVGQRSEWVSNEYYNSRRQKLAMEVVKCTKDTAYLSETMTVNDSFSIINPSFLLIQASGVYYEGATYPFTKLSKTSTGFANGFRTDDSSEPIMLSTDYLNSLWTLYSPGQSTVKYYIRHDAHYAIGTQIIGQVTALIQWIRRENEGGPSTCFILNSKGNLSQTIEFEYDPLGEPSYTLVRK